MSDSVGDFMQKGKDDAIKKLVSFFGILVYVAGVLYAEVHGYSLLSRGVDPDMILWATIGIVALGITALVMPLGLHYSFHGNLQRIAAFAFYAVDLGLMIFNAVVDYLTRTSGAVPSWLSMYMTYIMPSTPIIAAVGWSLMWLLDPAQKMRGMIEAARASATEALVVRVAEQAKRADISEEVDEAAQQMARDIVRSTLGAGTAMTGRKLAAGQQVIEGRARDVEEPKRVTQREPRRSWWQRGKAEQTIYEPAPKTAGKASGERRSHKDRAHYRMASTTYAADASTPEQRSERIVPEDKGAGKPADPTRQRGRGA